jgi:hypothetical protein
MSHSTARARGRFQGGGSGAPGGPLWTVVSSTAALVQGDGAPEAVVVTIPRRRHDPDPSAKSVVVLHAATGKPVADAPALRVDNASGDVVFRPNPGGRGSWALGDSGRDQDHVVRPPECLSSYAMPHPAVSCPGSKRESVPEGARGPR